MTYWDASAVVPLLVDQPRSAESWAILEADPAMVTWWGTATECLSALMRLHREGLLSAPALAAAERRLAHLRDGWDEVLPTEACRRTAERMLRVHPLRTADAFQLAAALLAADQDPTLLPVACFDLRLLAAAAREGFPCPA